MGKYEIHFFCIQQLIYILIYCNNKVRSCRTKSSLENSWRIGIRTTSTTTRKKLHDEESDVDCVENDYGHTDTEESGDEENYAEIFIISSDDGPNFVDKHGKTIWKVHKTRKPSRTLKHNIVTKLPGVKTIAKYAKAPLDTWNLFITNDMVENIERTQIYMTKSSV